MTSSGAPDGTERSIWGLEVKNEHHAVSLWLGQTQVQGAPRGQSAENGPVIPLNTEPSIAPSPLAVKKSPDFVFKQ